MAKTVNAVKLLRSHALHDLDAGDVVELPVVESYRTLNLKALSMLSWAHKTYPNLQWLVRHDDDVYLRAPALLAQLSSRPPIRYFWGMFDHGSSPVRDPLHQHYNSYEQFPKQEHPAWGDIFPPYVFWLARRLKVWPTGQTLIPCLGLCKACGKLGLFQFLHVCSPQGERSALGNVS